MQDKKIFNNYQDKCPICDGDLDATHQFCPYCGANLQEMNAHHRDNETIIAGALDEIDEAKKRLAYREKQYKENEKQGSAFQKICKWIIIISIVSFLLLLGIGLILTFVEEMQNKKVEELKQSLLLQEVETDKYDEIDLDDYDFRDTKHQSAAGYVKDGDGVFAIPFYSDSYSTDGAFKGMIYMESDGFEEFYSVYNDRISIVYDGCHIVITTNDGYYDKTTDALPLYDSDRINNTKRLNDVQIGDVLFECYQVEEDYVMVTNPFADCFLVLEGSPSYDNAYFSFEEMMKVLRVDCDFELSY